MFRYQEPEPVSVAEMQAHAAPPPEGERVATHKQALVIDMVSIEKSKYERMEKFYAKRYVLCGFIALAAFLLGMLLRFMADAQDVAR